MQTIKSEADRGKHGLPPVCVAAASYVRTAATWIAFLVSLPTYGAVRQVLIQPPAAATQASSCAYCRIRAEQLREKAATLIRKETNAELKTAVEQLEKSARLLEQGQFYSDAAQNYIKIGEIYSTWSRYQSALEMYDKALSRSQNSDIDLRCSIFSHQARAYLDLSKYPKAVEISNQAGELVESTSNPRVKAEVLETLGAISLAKNPEQALEASRSAAEFYKRANDLDGEARALLTSGHAYVHLKGKLSDASKAYTQALQLWTQANNRHGIAQAQGAIALILVTKGEPQSAIRNYNAARKVFHKAGDRDREAIILNGLGGVSRQIGNYDESLRSYTEARIIFSQVGDLGGEIGAVGGAAQAALALHQWTQASELTAAKVRLLKTLDHPRFEASAWSELGDIAVRQGNYRKAEYTYLKALFIYRSADHAIGEAEVLIGLGHLYSEQARNEEALSHLHKALGIVQGMEQVSQVARVHSEIAAVYFHQHHLDDAKNEIEKALKLIESQRTKVASFDDRASYFASVHEYYQLDIEILMQLDRRDPGKGFAQKALEAAEKSKVRSLLDMLGPGSAPSSLTLREIQAEIRGDDVVLLEYALGKERSYLWTITQAGMRSFEISLSTKILGEMEKRLRDSLLAPGIHLRETAAQERIRNKQADATYLRERQRLAGVLLGPVLPALERKKIIVVPDGFLQYVPFVTLFPEQDRDLVMLPSASALKALRRAATKRPAADADVMIVVDPVFEDDDERFARASVSVQKTHWSSDASLASRDISGSPYIPRLPESRNEGQAIAKIYHKEKVVLIQDFDATREIASRALPHYRIAHFGTHGFLDTRRPERSGLVLSMFDKDGRRLNGYLRLRDIYQLKLSADLVVLSACESALGKDLESEGMIGLTRAFLYAGSKRIISTLWKVNDQAAAELMKHFYQRLHGGESPSHALRGAQADLAANPKWNSPYYWAAFVLQGEYRWGRKP